MNVVLTVKDKDRVLHAKMVLNCSWTTIPMELMTKLSCSITNKGHLYLFAPIDVYLAGMPIVSRTKTGATPLRPIFRSALK